jgi:hypothetical protein
MQQQHALETEETCTQYNMLKIARYLFSWTGNVTYADYYERAITNGLLGTQRMPAFGDHRENKFLEKQHQQHQHVQQAIHSTALDHRDHKSSENQHQQHQHVAAAQGTGAEALLQLDSTTGNDVSVSR